MQTRRRNDGGDENPIGALVADTDPDPGAVRLSLVLVLTDLFAADPEMRGRFLESLQSARAKAVNEKTDSKVLTIDMALSLIQSIPATETGTQ